MPCLCRKSGSQVSRQRYLLHVMESVPESLESRLKDLLGKDQWEMLHKKHELTSGPPSSAKKPAFQPIYKALGSFSDTARNEECRYTVENILCQGWACGGYDSGNRRGRRVRPHCNRVQQTMFTDAKSMGHRAKSFLKRSRIPVLMIPPVDE